MASNKSNNGGSVGYGPGNKSVGGGASANDSTISSRVKTWFFATSLNGECSSSSSNGAGTGGYGGYGAGGCKAKDMRGMNVWMPQSL